MKVFTQKLIGALHTNGFIDDEDLGLYEYALNILLTGILHFAISLFVGFVFGMVKESLALFVSFLIIRKFAGGFHASTPRKCYVVSITLNCIMLGFIKVILLMSADIIFYIVLTISTLSVVIMSPIEAPQKPFSEKEKRVFKAVSIILSVVLSFAAFLTYVFWEKSLGLAICFGLFMETIVLTMAHIKSKKADVIL